MEKRKLKVAVYIRVSTEDQENRSTYENQMNVIERYIENRNESLELAGEEYVYKDLWISGASPIEERPALSQLKNDLQYYSEIGEKPFDLVIVYRLDRVARSLSILLETLELLNNYGVGYISTQEAIDTSTSFWRAMVWIIWTFAELERALINERTQEGIKRSQQKGIWTKKKYGYDIVKGRPVINKKEASVVKDIFHLFAYKKYSISQIIQQLESDKIQRPGTSRLGKNIFLWEDNTIRKYLADEAYIGKYYYKKTQNTKKGNKHKTEYRDKSDRILSDIPHDPIIDEETFWKVQERLQEMRIGSSRGQKHNEEGEIKYILSEFLRCDHCKKYRHWQHMCHFKGTGSWKTKQYYVCNGKDTKKNKETYICPVVPIAKDDLELLVLHHIKNIFYMPNKIATFLVNSNKNEVARNFLQDNISKLRKKIDEKYIQEKKNKIRDLYLEWDIEKIDYQNKKKEIENQVAIDKQKLEEYLSLQKEDHRVKTYEKTIKILQELWNIKKLLEDRNLLARLLKLLVKEIIVYSREITNDDVVAWRKKTWGIKQYIPYHIEIIFHLPSDIIEWFISERLNPTPTTSENTIKMRNWKFYHWDSEVNLSKELEKLNNSTSSSPMNKPHIIPNNSLQLDHNSHITSYLNDCPMLSLGVWDLGFIFFVY